MLLFASTFPFLYFIYGIRLAQSKVVVRMSIKISMVKHDGATSLRISDTRSPVSNRIVFVG